MKKQLLKVTLLALVVFFGTATANAQEEYSTPGMYTIGAYESAVSNLVLTIDPGAPNFLKWGVRVDGNAAQEFAFQDHVAPSGAGFMSLTAELPDGQGGTIMFALGTKAELVSGKNITLSANIGGLVTDSSDPLYGYDQFQRRKSGTSQGSNDAIFIKVPGEGGSRYGVIPAADGDPVQFDGGGIDKIEFKRVGDLPAANINSFGQDAFVIPNPINDQLTIKGATADVSEVSVYSVLGSKVLSQAISGSGDIELNVSNLSNGLYIVEILGNKGERYTQKLVKN